MLDPALSQQLRTHLGKIRQPIELAASLDDGPSSAEMLGLLEEVAALSDKIVVSRDGVASRRPSFAVRRTGSDVAVHFAALPVGHEFTSFVLALLHVGGHPPAVTEEVRQQIQEIEGQHVFESFISLSCQICPDVVQALNILSVLNPRIRHTVIDGSLFRQEVEEREVMAVPSLFRNGEPFSQGRTSLEEIVEKLGTGAGRRAADRIRAKDPFDVLIVGGGPAGASAAVYAARKGLRTGIVAERFGGQLLDTAGIENLISDPYTEGPKLAAVLERNVGEHDVDVMTRQQATKLRSAAGAGGLIGIELASGASLAARSVVLTTGARWRQLGVPGESEYANRGVAYCPHCDGPLFKGKRVAVIGGGNSGVEAAIDLAGIVEHVTLVEFEPKLRADDVLQRKLGSLPNVDIVVHAETTGIVGDGSRVSGLSYRNRGTGVDHQLDLEGVFVQIGLLPNTEWLRGAVDLTPYGEVEIDEGGRTSVPGVFAAGDCTTVPYKQIVVALGAGSTAVLSAFDYLIRTSSPLEASVA